ncbi:lysylphosphatidylglycerol synthase transmembrane domain-containing protein [Spirosoma soli]|uniref:Lysylphosphatidylglycerol synthase transmembrane domain-containing protein n=1 Tax=Spirosoma soli TaxID=1770529 RepID=A0ABW5M605_9BACT
MKRLLRRVLPVGLAVALLLYALKDTSINDVGKQFRQANYLWLFVVGCIIGLYYIARAARWQLTLQALHYQPSLFRTTIALLAGSMASMIVPGAGELTRCGTLQRTDSIPLSKSLGSVVAERVIDLLMLGVLVALTFLLEFKRVGQYIASLLKPLASRIAPNGNGLFLLACALLIIGGAIGLLYWLLRQEAFRQHRWIVRATTVGRNIGEGFLSIRQLKRPVLFVALTLGSYLLSFLTTYILFFASSQTVSLPPTAALTILTVSSLGGLAVPTQGGLGTYHFLVSRVLMLYGMNEVEGVVIATFLHAVQTGFALLLSSLSFITVPLLVAARKKRDKVPTLSP